jgi:hypothetical protein
VFPGKVASTSLLYRKSQKINVPEHKHIHGNDFEPKFVIKEPATSHKETGPDTVNN